MARYLRTLSEAPAELAANATPSHHATNDVRQVDMPIQARASQQTLPAVSPAPDAVVRQYAFPIVPPLSQPTIRQSPRVLSTYSDAQQPQDSSVDSLFSTPPYPNASYVPSLPSRPAGRHR